VKRRSPATKRRVARPSRRPNPSDRVAAPHAHLMLPGEALAPADAAAVALLDACAQAAEDWRGAVAVLAARDPRYQGFAHAAEVALLAARDWFSGITPAAFAFGSAAALRRELAARADERPLAQSLAHIAHAIEAAGHGAPPFEAVVLRQFAVFLRTRATPPWWPMEWRDDLARAGRCLR